jgi:tetratricopeptide (TPR) repeat protein
MGLTLSKLGRQEEAIEQYQTALRLNPSNAECHNNLGILLMDQGNIDEAIQEFAEAVRLKPDFVDAISNRELALKLRQASR